MADPLRGNYTTRKNPTIWDPSIYMSLTFEPNGAVLYPLKIYNFYLLNIQCLARVVLPTSE